MVEGSYHYRRGYDDGAKGRGSLFRNVGGRIVADSDDPASDEWTSEARADYVAGYDDGAAFAFYS